MCSNVFGVYRFICLCRQICKAVCSHLFLYNATSVTNVLTSSQLLVVLIQLQVLNKVNVITGAGYFSSFTMMIID